MLVLLASLGLVAPGQAATVSQDPQTRVIAVTGDGAEVNDILVVRGGVVRIRDRAAQVRLDPSAADSCLVVDASEVSCSANWSIDVLPGAGADNFAASGNLDRVSADLGPGADTADASGILVRGGEGNDRLSGTLLWGGAGDDRLEIDPDAPGGSANGEAGDDLVLGNEGMNQLIGGAGRDRLEGRGGNDTLRDFETGAGEGADVYDGGPGRDTLSYDQDMNPGPVRSAGVHIDLAAGTAGAPGEGDRMIGIEDAVGTRVADVLEGGPGDDVLEGGDGPDVVDGRGGPDFLGGGRGADRVVGGEGNDRLSGDFDDDVLAGGAGDDELVDLFGRDTLLGEDGQDRLNAGHGADRLDGGAGHDAIQAVGDFAVDAVGCGPGLDTVTMDTADAAGADCEAVDRVPFPPFLKPAAQKRRAAASVRGRTALLRVGCSYDYLLPKDRGTVVLFLGGREIGRADWACGSFESRIPGDDRRFIFVGVPLTRDGAKRVHRDRRIRVVAMLHFGVPDQAPVKERLYLRLRTAA